MTVKGLAMRVNIVDLILSLALGALTLAVVGFMAPLGFNGGFVDMAHDGYQLRQALDLSAGGMLFRDTFDQYGPLTPYLNQLGFVTLGRRLLAIKYFLALWYGFTAVAMFALARHFLGRTLAVVSVVAWLATAPFYQHGIMISPHAYAVLFQAVALILLLRGGGRVETPRRLWIIGALCGVGWLLKQSLGSLFFAAIVGFMVAIAVLDRSALRPLIGRVWRLAVGFAGIVIPVLLWLAWRGALDDWYRQTVLFPRMFYLAEASAGWSLIGTLTAFFTEQLTAEGFWLALRTIVIGGAVVLMLLRSQDPDPKLVLAVSVTAVLWLAAFPSANFMHQWWTLSPTFCAALYVLQQLIGRAVGTDARWARFATQAATVAVFVWLAWSPVDARWQAASERHGKLLDTISEPRTLSGIRTNAPTLNALSTMYRLSLDYRARHPGAPIVTIDSTDGRAANAQSLPLLSFFEDNDHPLPVFWSLEALSTEVYPTYAETTSMFLRERAALLVDFRGGLLGPRAVHGYRILHTAQLPDGYLSLYEPDPDAATLDPIVPVLERFPGALSPLVNAPDRFATAPPLNLSAANLSLRDRLTAALQRHMWWNQVMVWSTSGEQAKAAASREAGLQLVDDYRILTDAGAPEPVVLHRMVDAINNYVGAVAWTGSAMPDEVMPLMTAAIAARALKDPSGDPIRTRQALDRTIRALRFRSPRYLVDPETRLRHRAAVGGWPDADWLPDPLPALKLPAPEEIGTTADIEVKNDQWRVKGIVTGPASYMLQLKPRTLQAGTHFVATGELIEGGFSIGLLRNSAWVGTTHVLIPGWFVATVTVPETGEYELVVANSLQPTYWRSQLVSAGLGRFFPSLLSRNDFRILNAGWVTPAPPATAIAADGPGKP